MTTPAAANYYLAGHLLEMDGKPNAVFNPNNQPVETLPVIFGFNNGGRPEWWSAQLIAEDGTGLGGHLCSHEGYMRHDLGIFEGARPDRHETFQKHYPNGYRMAFVPRSEVETCEPLLRALELNKQIPDAQESASPQTKLERDSAPTPTRSPSIHAKHNMTKFIELPTGDLIHAEAIRAIRLGDPRPKGEAAHESELKPRVIVDFTIGEHGNVIVVDCESLEQRNELAAKLRSQLPL